MNSYVFDHPEIFATIATHILIQYRSINPLPYVFLLGFQPLLNAFLNLQNILSFFLNRTYFSDVGGVLMMNI